MENNRDEYAVVAWQINDIKSVRPSWTDDECKNFLDRYETDIEEKMIRAGWDSIHLFLEEDDPETYCEDCHFVMNPVLIDSVETKECSNPHCSSHRKSVCKHCGFVINPIAGVCSYCPERNEE